MSGVLFLQQPLEESALQQRLLFPSVRMVFLKEMLCGGGGVGEVVPGGGAKKGPSVFPPSPSPDINNHNLIPFPPAFLIFCPPLSVV
jgi:hypothetical protein